MCVRSSPSLLPSPPLEFFFFRPLYIDVGYAIRRANWVASGMGYWGGDWPKHCPMYLGHPPLLAPSLSRRVDAAWALVERLSERPWRGRWCVLRAACGLDRNWLCGAPAPVCGRLVGIAGGVEGSGRHVPLLVICTVIGWNCAAHHCAKDRVVTIRDRRISPPRPLRACNSC